jgi:hypothetical protein
LLKITVYRFQYFDRSTEQFSSSDDFATEKAIREMGATPLEHTAKEVDERWLSHSGIVMRRVD